MSGRRIIYMAAMAVLAFAAGIFVTGSNSQATTFHPEIAGISVDDKTLGAHSNIRIPFVINAPDSNFGAYPVVFNSPEVLSSSTMPVGHTVGYLNATATLGIMNQGCFTEKVVNFRLIQASTDNSPGNSVPPKGPPSDPVAGYAGDDGDIDEDNIVDDESRKANGIPDGAEWYPAFLNTMFNNQQPTVRYLGVQLVSGTPVHAVIQIVMFDPGDFYNLPSLPSSDLLTAARGTPTGVILNDPTAVPPQAIEDFCTSLTTDTLLCAWSDATPDDAMSGGDCDLGSDTVGEPAQGQPSSCSNAIDDDYDGVVNDGCPAVGAPETGAQCTDKVDSDGDGKPNDGCPIVSATLYPRGTNPSNPGTYDLAMLSISQRDQDNDGIENWLDPCPYNATTNWDPRATPTQNQAAGSDNDADNLPNVCDLTPNTLNHDADGDNWFNRVDNCPQVSNVATVMETPNQNQLDFDHFTDPPTPVPDGGPPIDFIGPECDSQPLIPNGHYHSSLLVSHVCVGGTDNDGDGVCNDYPGENDANPDTDGDGVPDGSDNCIGRANAPLGGGTLPQMTPDLNGDGQAHIEDVTYIAARFGKQLGQDKYRASAELASQDGIIHIDDVTSIAAAFGKRC